MEKYAYKYQAKDEGKVPTLDIFSNTATSTATATRDFYTLKSSSRSNHNPIKNREIVLSDFVKTQYRSPQAKSIDKIQSRRHNPQLLSPSHHAKLRTYQNSNIHPRPVGQQYLWKSIDKLHNYNEETLQLFRCQKCRHTPKRYKNQLPFNREPLQHYFVYNVNSHDGKCTCLHNFQGRRNSNSPDYYNFLGELNSNSKEKQDTYNNAHENDISRANFSFSAEKNAPKEHINSNSLNHNPYLNQEYTEATALNATQSKNIGNSSLMNYSQERQRIENLKKTLQKYGVHSLQKQDIKELMRRIQELSKSIQDNKKTIAQPTQRVEEGRNESINKQSETYSYTITKKNNTQEVESQAKLSEFRAKLGKLFEGVTQFDNQFDRKLSVYADRPVPLDELIEIKNENIESGHEFIKKLDSFIHRTDRYDRPIGLFESKFFDS